MHDKIGPLLRQARMRRNVSLRSLASAAGVSPSQLSQIETGKSMPSVSTLYALVTHLGISLDQLLGIADTPNAAEVTADNGALSVPASAIQRAADNPVLEMENGVRWERLATETRSDIDALLVTYEPGAASSTDRTMMRHQGTEHAYLFAGQLTLLLDFERHILEPGDSLCFDSTRPHLYVNQGNATARGVWFVSGRHERVRTRDWVASQLGGADQHHHAAPVDSASSVLDLLAALQPVPEQRLPDQPDRT